MVDPGTLAEVAVEVSANLAPFEAGMARAKEQARAAERDLQKIVDPRVAQARANAAAYRKMEQQHLANAQAHRRLAAEADKATAAMRNELLLVDRVRAAHGGSVPPINNHERALNRLGRTAGTVSLFMRGLIGVIGVDTAMRLAGATTQILKTTAAIGDLSQEIGLSTTQFQEWRGVGSMLSIDMKDMESGLKEFAENTRQAAAGAEREEKAFKLLGVALKDAGGNARPLNDILRNTIERLGQVHDPLQRGAALALLFGEAAGPKMAKLIDAGTGKIDELTKAVHETGMVLSEDQIQKADQTARKLEQVKNVLNAKIASTVVDNASAISDLADALAQVAEWGVKAAASFAKFLASLGGGGYQIGQGRGAVSIGGPNSIIDRFATQGYPVGLGFGLDRKATHATGFGKAGTSVTVPLAGTSLKNIMSTGLDPTEWGGPKGGGIDLSSLFDRRRGRGGRGRRGREVENIFEREELQAAQERLRLLREATADLERRNEIDRQLIDLRLQEKYVQIDRQVKEKRLTEAQGKELKRQEAANAQLEREAADRQMRADLIEQSARRAEALLDAESQMLQASQALARTDEERIKIEASLLRNKQQQELMEIDKQIAIARELGDQQKIADLVELRRKILERHAVETKGFAVESLRGIEKFRNDLPKTVKEINEQIDNIRFDKFMEKLQDAARFAEDVGDAFGRAAGRIANFENPLEVLRGLLQDLSATLTEQFIVKPVSDFATQKIGMPLAKQAFGKDLTGPDALTVQQMNLALDLATTNLHGLSQAAMAASAAMGGGGMAAGAAQAADQLGQAAGSTGQEFAALDPQLSQFGSGLMSVLAGLGGGGGGGLAGFLKMGLSLAGSALGAGMGGGGAGAALGGGTNWITTPIPTFTVPGLGGYADGGWIGGWGTGTSDSMMIRASVGEHMTNAMAAGKFAPVLDGINSGRIPDIPSLGRMLGGQSLFAPRMSFGDFVFPGIRDAREARSAARQMVSEIQREMSLTIRAGYRMPQ